MGAVCSRCGVAHGAEACPEVATGSTRLLDHPPGDRELRKAEADRKRLLDAINAMREAVADAGSIRLGANGERRLTLSAEAVEAVVRVAHEVSS